MELKGNLNTMEFQKPISFYYKTPPWDSMRQIDIALDCFPHNSGTTLVEHLYMGNPLLPIQIDQVWGELGKYLQFRSS